MQGQPNYACFPPFVDLSRFGLGASVGADMTNGNNVRKAVVNAWPKSACYRSWWRETKLRPNESATPTLNPLRVDRAPT